MLTKNQNFNHGNRLILRKFCLRNALVSANTILTIRFKIRFKESFGFKLFYVRRHYRDRFRFLGLRHRALCSSFMRQFLFLFKNKN